MRAAPLIITGTIVSSYQSTHFLWQNLPISINKGTFPFFLSISDPL